MSSEPLARGNTAAIEGRACRVCYSGDSDVASGPLIAPCRCSGSMQWIHQNCLDRWRFERLSVLSSQRSCEVCGYVFKYETSQPSRCESCAHTLARASPMLVGMLFALVGIWARTSSWRRAVLTVGFLLGILGIVDVVRFMRDWIRMSLSRSDDATLSPMAASAILVFAKWTQSRIREHAHDMRQRVDIESALISDRQAVEDNVLAARSAGIDHADGDTDPGGDLRALCACIGGCCCATVFVVLIIAFLATHVSLHTLELGGLFVAGLGGVYLMVVAATAASSLLCLPPLAMRRGLLGLALVRSISEHELHEQ